MEVFHASYVHAAGAPATRRPSVMSAGRGSRRGSMVRHFAFVSACLWLSSVRVSCFLIGRGTLQARTADGVEVQWYTVEHTFLGSYPHPPARSLTRSTRPAPARAPSQARPQTPRPPCLAPTTLVPARPAACLLLPPVPGCHSGWVVGVVWAGWIRGVLVGEVVCLVG